MLQDVDGSALCCHPEVAQKERSAPLCTLRASGTKLHDVRQFFGRGSQLSDHYGLLSEFQVADLNSTRVHWLAIFGAGQAVVGMGGGRHASADGFEPYPIIPPCDPIKRSMLRSRCIGLLCVAR